MLCNLIRLKQRKRSVQLKTDRWKWSSTANFTPTAPFLCPNASILTAKRGKTRTNRHQSTTYATYLNWGEVEGIWTIKKRWKIHISIHSADYISKPVVPITNSCPCSPTHPSSSSLFPFRNTQPCQSQTLSPQSPVTFLCCLQSKSHSPINCNKSALDRTINYYRY